MFMTAALKLSISPDDTRALARVRGRVRTWLSSVEASEPDDLVLAVDEAVANAIEHGGAEVVVSAREEQGSVFFVVFDRGRWRPAGDYKWRGRGIAIMRALVDDVQIEPSPSGTTVVLRRRLHLG
jgi:anti-sigma regulatory factor (Ser/Thr protein kinase)